MENYTDTKNKMKVETEIKKLKENLINKAKKKGIYENFGQVEVSKLKDKFLYNFYATEPKIIDEIDNFDKWCMNFNDNDLAKV